MTTLYEVRRMHGYDRTEGVYQIDDVVCRCGSMALAVYMLGRRSAGAKLFGVGGVDFNAGQTKFGHEFRTPKGIPEYWYVKEV